MRRQSIIIIFLVFIHFPFSCDEIGAPDPCGGPTTPREARITEISSFVGNHASGGFATGTFTTFDLAAIQLVITEMEYYEVASQFRPMSFMNSVFACSPVDPTPTQAINSIQITSEQPIYSGGNTFEAGSDVADLFKVVQFSYKADEISLDEYIQEQNNDLWLFGYTGADIVLQLKDQPDSIINQTFSIAFELSDNATVTFETPVFEVDR